MENKQNEWVVSTHQGEEDRICVQWQDVEGHQWSIWHSPGERHYQEALELLLAGY